MAKVDFSNSATPEITPEPCRFDSALGMVFMNLIPLNDRRMGLMQKRRDELVARYITGGWTDKDAQGNDRYNEKPEVYVLPGEMLPLQGGLDERTLLKIARVEMMQVARAGETYTFDDLVPMIERSGDTWEAIMLKCFEIQASYKLGKAWPVPPETPTTPLSGTDSPA